MLKQLKQLNWSKYMKIIGAVMIVNVIVVSFLQYKSHEAQVVADEFMKLVYKGQTESISGYLSDNNLFYKNQEAFSDIRHYEISGFGIDPDGSASIHYFVTGLPADNRNIDLKLKKDGTSWIITGIHINYHINREDKAFAEQVAEWFTCGEVTNLRRHITDYDEKVFGPILSACRNEKLILQKTEIQYPGKYEKDIRRVKFYYAGTDGTIRMIFRLKYQNDYSVESVSVE
jgi:hypothetical protein